MSWTSLVYFVIFASVPETSLYWIFIIIIIIE